MQGVLLKVKTDSVLQHDMRDSDIAFQYTTVSNCNSFVTFHTDEADCMGYVGVKFRQYLFRKIVVVI